MCAARIAETFSIVAKTDGLTRVTFREANGRSTEIGFPSASLNILIENLQRCRADAVTPVAQFKIGSTSLWSTPLTKIPDLRQLTKFQPGPHGSIQVGVTADFHRVWLWLRTPDGIEIQVAAPPEEVRALPAALSESLALVASPPPSGNA